jgi:SRSO17 transposase
MAGPSEGSEARFAAYVEALGTVLGHADRREPIARKSVEPMAAVTGRGEASIFVSFVGNAPWSDAAMLAKVGELMLPAIERSGSVEV